MVTNFPYIHANGHCNDDELFSKTVQIDKNAGNDEVAQSDDANNI